MTHAVPEARRRGRPPRINRERIVEAAFELGIENLTMAAVAERLGVSHQSLYGWVRNRDELIDLVSDRLISGVRVRTEPDPAEWRRTIRRIIDGLREISIRYPGFAAAALVRYRTTPAYLSLNEQVVRSLTTAGFEPVTAQVTYENVAAMALGWLVREEATAAIRMEPTQIAGALDAATTDGSIGHATAAAATAAMVVAADERYRFMVDALLAGLPEPEPASTKPDDLLDIREDLPAAVR